MRKIALVLALASGLSLLGGTASAVDVCTAAGCTRVATSRYLLVLDGADGNPDPSDGFISVSNGGKVCADDNGKEDDGNATNGKESSSPTCSP